MTRRFKVYSDFNMLKHVNRLLTDVSQLKQIQQFLWIPSLVPDRTARLVPKSFDKWRQCVPHANEEGQWLVVWWWVEGCRCQS